MKFARCLIDGQALWVAVDPQHDRATPVEGAFEKLASAWFRGEVDGVLAKEHHKLSQLQLLAPVEPTAKIVCIGLNYRSHVEAFGRPMPDAPMAFLKAMTAVIPQDGALIYPTLTKELDYEIELVGVVGREIRSGERPSAALFGYTIGNDVSARDLQRSGPRGPDLYSGKSLNDTCGIGPWIVTADEISAPPDLAMELRVNGEVRQKDRTSKMEWDIDFLLSYVNARSRLLPGDLLFTGTPAGVALEDGRFLKPGDVIEVEIENIGVLRNRVVASDTVRK
jgi:2-keto-4-pentenoate hydratase/2-oxohepta-3-ene-1,7-dioic acid hydratase in catechol pathway